ncbi:hypothetical protein MKX01_035731 [Papaver californicum]|nr:hypothetical protein MKX01_035731 [Papaver californicum]
MNDKIELKDLNKQLAIVLQTQEVVANALKNNPSHVLLARCKEILATKAKKLLLLEYRIYVSESVDENWKSNSAESFESIGYVLKEVTLVEKEIDQKLGETPIDSILGKDFIRNSSIPTTTEEGNCRSTPKIDFSDCVKGINKIMEKYDGKLVYEIVFQHGYQLDSMFMNLVVFVIVKYNDRCYSRKLFAKMAPGDNITNYN